MGFKFWSIRYYLLLIMLKAKRYLHSNGSSFQFLVDEDKAIHDGTEFDSSGVLVKAHKGRDASIIAAWKWLKIHLPKDVVTQEFKQDTGRLRSELYGIGILELLTFIIYSYGT